MSRNAFTHIEREYAEDMDRREHTKVERAQAYRYWIIPKNGSPPWIIRAAGDDQNAKDTAVAWWGVAPDSFYVSRVD